MAETITTIRPTTCVEIAQAWRRYFDYEYDWGGRGKPSSNRASELPHPCDNYCLFCRTAWNERPRPVAHTLGLFRQGISMEQETVRLLEDMGIETRRAQWTLEWPEYQIAGHIDREIMLPGESSWLIAELKAMNANTFAGIHEVADLFRASFWVHRKYPGQLLLYMLLHNTERALLILRDKGSSDLKPLWLYLDEHLEYAEGLIQRAERVNRALAEGTPELTKLCDPGVCEGCDFYHVCAPDLSFAAPLLFVEEDFIADLRRRDELKPAAEEYAKLDKKVKGMLARVEWGETSTGYAGEFTIRRATNKNGAVGFRINRSLESPTTEEGNGNG